MRKQKINPHGRHRFNHAYTPSVGLPQKYKQRGTDKSYNEFLDNRGKQREHIQKSEHCRQGDSVYKHKNALQRQTPLIGPDYYHKNPSLKSGSFNPLAGPVYRSDSSITNAASYDESADSYRGSLVSVVSSFDDLQARTHEYDVRQHHPHVYPHSDNERISANPVYTLHSSQEWKQRSAVERRTHQINNKKPHQKYQNKMLSDPIIMSNNNSNQPLAYSVYSTHINHNNHNNNSNNKVPLMVFRRNESKRTANSDVVYIPVVILPEKQGNKNTSNGANREKAKEGNENAFSQLNYPFQSNSAENQVGGNRTINNDAPLILCNDEMYSEKYRGVPNQNMFTETNFQVFNNNVEMNTKPNRNIFVDKTYTTKPITTNEVKHSNKESVFGRQHFLYNNSSIESEKLQGTITYNDSVTTPKTNHINVMVAEFDKVPNLFENIAENTRLASASAKYSDNEKQKVIQCSQSVQVSEIPCLMKESEEAITNNIKLKGEKPGIISEQLTEFVSCSKDSTQNKERKYDDSREKSKDTAREIKSDNESKSKENIQEINKIVNNNSGKRNESKNEGRRDNNCYQTNEFSKKESNENGCFNNKKSSEKRGQFVAENLFLKDGRIETPKNINSSFCQKNTYEAPFKKLFGNDYKMTSQFPYFQTGMYVNSPMVMENSYKWLAEPNQGFIETTPYKFMGITRKQKNMQAVFPFYTKVKKAKSQEKVDEEKKEEGKEDKKEDKEESKKEDSQQEIVKEKTEQKNKTRKSVESVAKNQIEIKLSGLWDYIIQGFNLYLGKTVHTLLIDGLYTFGSVTEKLQNKED